MRHALIVSLAALAACAQPEGASADALIWTDAPPPAAPTLFLSAPPATSVGGVLQLSVTGANPNETITVVLGIGVGDGPCPAAIGGVCTALTGPLRVVGSARANQFGNAVINVQIPTTTPLDSFGYFQAFVRRGPGNVNTIVSNVERVRTNDGSSRVRVVHASPNAPAVDIYANGSLLVPGLSYLEATPFVRVPEGDYTIDIRPALADPASTPVYTTQVTLVADFDFTAVAAGFLGSPNASDTFRVLPLAEDWSSPFPGTFYARVVHAGADAPAVAIDVGNDGVLDFAPLFRFGETGLTGIPLPADTSLQVAAAIPGAALPFTLPAFTADDEITVIATGRVAARPNEPDAFGLLALNRDGVIGFVRQNPQVYVLHASPDAPAVDLQVGGATIVDDLSFRQLKGPVVVPPGPYDIDIFDATGAQYVGTVQTPSLQAGERYLAVASGFFTPAQDEPLFQVNYFADSAQIVDGTAALQVIHASPDAPTVEVGVTNPDGSFLAITNPLTFPNEFSPGGVLVGPGNYPIAVAQPFGPVLFRFPELPLAIGDRYFAVATGSVNEGNFGITVIDPTVRPWAAITALPTP
jgi:hypothetical protein